MERHTVRSSLCDLPHSSSKSLLNTTENIKRQWRLHNGYKFNDRYINYGYFYCREEDVPNKDTPNGKDPLFECDEYTHAYSWTKASWLSYTHRVVLCPKFWLTTTKSLTKLTEELNGDINKQREIDDWTWTRGATIFHETYHWVSQKAHFLPFGSVAACMIQRHLLFSFY